MIHPPKILQVITAGGQPPKKSLFSQSQLGYSAIPQPSEFGPEVWKIELLRQTMCMIFTFKAPPDLRGNPWKILLDRDHPGRNQVPHNRHEFLMKSRAGIVDTRGDVVA